MPMPPAPPAATSPTAAYDWNLHRLAVGLKTLRIEDWITTQLQVIMSLTVSTAARDLATRALVASLPERLRDRVRYAGPLHSVSLPGSLHPDLLLVDAMGRAVIALENKLYRTKVNYPKIIRLSTQLQSQDPLAATFNLAAYRAEGWSRVSQFDLYRCFPAAWLPQGVTLQPLQTLWLLFTEHPTATATTMCTWSHTRRTWHTSRYAAAARLLAAEVNAGLPTVPGGLTGQDGRELVKLLRMLAS